MIEEETFYCMICEEVHGRAEVRFLYKTAFKATRSNHLSVGICMKYSKCLESNQQGLDCENLG